MKKLGKMLMIVLLSFILLGGGKTLLTSAAVNVPSQTFNLGPNVDGVWDKDTQTLTVQGNGKIANTSWTTLRDNLQLTSQPIAKIEVKSTVKLPDNASKFFQGFLTSEIIFETGFDASNITNASSMFHGTKNLTSPIVFEDLSSVVNLEGMFQFSAVPSVILKKTTKAKNMNGAFSDSKVAHVEIEDTRNMETAAGMFYATKNFVTGNLPTWNTSKLKNARLMFQGAEKFNLNLNSWDLSKLEEGTLMFQGTKNLNIPMVFNDMSALVSANLMFDGSTVPSVIMKKTHKLENTDGMFNNSQVSTVEIEDMSKVKTANRMFALASNLSSDIIFNDLSALEKAESMFQGSGAPKVILKKTHNLKNANFMFQISKVKHVEIKDMEKIENARQMFLQADQLETLDIGDGNAPKLVDALSMFRGTSKLTSHIIFNDLSALENGSLMFIGSETPNVVLKKTQKLKKANDMFQRAKVKHVEIENTENIEDASQMFLEARELKTGNFSDWQLPKLLNALSMFRITPSLEASIHFSDLSSLENGSLMFDSSASPHVIMKKTHNLKNANFMFQNAKIEQVEIENTENIQRAIQMFDSANKLKTGNFQDWDTNKLEFSNGMFRGTTSLESPVIFNDLSSLENADGMFHNSAVPSVILKKTHKLQNMTNMFFGSSVGNVEIEDTSNVTTMHQTFRLAKNMVGDFSNWNVGNVTNMDSLFWGAKDFSSDLSNWNTSKVTNMHSMFRDSEKTFGDISNWDTSKVTMISNIFYNAKNIDFDISKWDISSLQLARSLLRTSFSRENYEKFLVSLLDKANNGFNLSNIKEIGFLPKYCAAYQTRDQLKNMTSTFPRWSRADTFDCAPKLTKSAPTLKSNSEITDTAFTFESLLPLTQSDLDNGLISIDVGPTNLQYSDFNCTLDGGDARKVICTVKITSTYESENRKIGLKVLKNVGPDSSGRPRIIATFLQSTGYLIDTKAPKLAQLEINTTPGIHTPIVTLKNFEDVGAAGMDRCELRYTDHGGVEQTISPLTLGAPVSLSFDPAELVHAVKVKCWDKVGNSSENEIKFPPIIEFDSANIKLSKQTMNGNFTIYSPSSFKIKHISVANPSDTGVTKITCNGLDLGLGVAVDFDNSPTNKVQCTFEGINKSGALKILAKDQNGAEGQNSESFIYDTTAPTIDIDPLASLTGSDLLFTIDIIDDNGVDAGDVTLDTLATSLDHADFTCIQKSPTRVQCSFTAENSIQNGTLKIDVIDKAGNQTSTTESNYTIDKIKPIISNLSSGASDFGRMRTLTFDTQDQGGAGLWKSGETVDPDYDSNAITYGLASDVACSDYSILDILSPQATEPFQNLTFDFTNTGSNGKYLCIQVKDKVGNLSVVSLATPINLNLAPTLTDKTTSLDENTAVGTVVFTLDGQDDNVGDTLSYQIISGNTGNAFSIAADKLLVNGPLDYETLNAYLLGVQVSDQHGLTGEAKITINLNDLDEVLPVITPISNVSYMINTAITPIQITATDNSGAVSLQVTGLPSGLTFDMTGSQIIGTTPALAGTHTITITARDTAGNEQTAQFTLTVTAPAPSTPSSSSRGGGGARLITDHCPNGDFSQSYYDGTCGTQGEPVQTKEVKPDLFNPTITTTCFNPLDQKTTDQGNPMSELLRSAHQMLYSYGLTRWQGTRDFAPDRYLTRQEAARFMTEFTTNVLCRKSNRTYNDHFTDLENADPTLIPYVQKSYEYLIFNGDANPNGDKEKTTFRPNDLITVDELAAIITRLVKNATLEENPLDWAQNYRLYIDSITANSTLKSGIRGTVAEVIYDLYRNNKYELKEIGYVIKD